METKSLCGELRRINSNRQVDHGVFAAGGGGVRAPTSMSAEATHPERWQEPWCDYVNHFYQPHIGIFSTHELYFYHEHTLSMTTLN